VTGSGPAPAFTDYARFYDALYADKDYAAECRSLGRLLGHHGVPAAARVLDLGCGTGGHVVPLAEAGYRMTGVDRSPHMLEIAGAKVAAAGLDATLTLGDVREIGLAAMFDAVISMFAVVGYQLTNHDIASMFAVARKHLVDGGIFVFDAWFGPAVLSQRPTETRKRVTLPDGGIVERVATPTLDVVAQTVRVDYRVVSEGGSAQASGEVRESHTVRFLFAQEVAYFLEVAGFDEIAVMPFMREGQVPTERDWNVTWVARASRHA
jgi:cyclopropane fatty-acyl-phospholipid synthase-like methyltransferase